MKPFKALLALVLILATAMPADAGCRRKARRQCQSAPVANVGYAYGTPQAVALTATAPTADPSGFLGWLNAVRAQYGRPPVAWSDEMASDAAINSSRGFGHSFMGRARRQNAGMGNLATVQVMWLQSPAHAAALLDPSITAVGLASSGNVWTYDAY